MIHNENGTRNEQRGVHTDVPKLMLKGLYPFKITHYPQELK